MKPSPPLRRQQRPAKQPPSQPAQKRPPGRALRAKGAQILELIGRAKGVALAEIMKATGWQAHSVREFLSTAAKKHLLKIESTKNEAGQRVYKIAK